MNKPDILLLHGALGCKKQLLELAEMLNEDFNVYCFDFSGHGEEPIPEKAFSIELFTFELASFCLNYNLSYINIFGFSMGGYVALNYAALFPHKVNKVFTLATKFDWNLQSAAKEAGMLNPDGIEQKVPAFAKQLMSLHGANKWKILLQKTSEMMLKLGNHATLKDNILSQITATCKLCVGDNDRMVSIEETENVKNKIKNATLHIFNDFEHPIEKINKNILAQEIKHFFKAI